MTRVLRFFRKKLVNSLFDKKISKYLAYAVGEILLIVLGVFIALWISGINNREEDIKNRERVLSEYLLDVYNHRKIYSDIENEFEETWKSINVLHKYISGKISLSSKEFDKHDYLAFQINIFETRGILSSGKYSQFINNGYTELIGNQRLEGLLSDYYSLRELFTRMNISGDVNFSFIKEKHYDLLTSDKTKSEFVDTSQYKILLEAQEDYLTKLENFNYELWLNNEDIAFHLVNELYPFGVFQTKKEIDLVNARVLFKLNKFLEGKNKVGQYDFIKIDSVYSHLVGVHSKYKYFIFPSANCEEELRKEIADIIKIEAEKLR